MRKELGKVPSEAYDFFKSKTPIRSGNARRKTRLQGSSIKTEYPYAQRLDEGWSKQAPQGMTKPTIEFIKNRVEELVGN
jgi:hypothetical protein